MALPGEQASDLASVNLTFLICAMREILAPFVTGLLEE